MPRTGKGGKREGASQTSYANRTDLNDRGPQPITAAPGQAYGERQMQEDAQRSIPMGGTATPNVTAPASPFPQAAIPPQANAGPVQLVPEPGSYLFDHPTERPDEHIMSGYNNVSRVDSPHERLAIALENAAMSPHATPDVQALAQLARFLVP